MTRQIVLPEKMTAAGIQDLVGLLSTVSDQPAIEIDGRGVRLLGALPAECLFRFVVQSRQGDVQVTVLASDDMKADLVTLGLDRILSENGASS